MPIPAGQGQTIINFSPNMNNNMDDISVGADSHSSATHGNGKTMDRESKKERFHPETRPEGYQKTRPEGYQKAEKDLAYGPNPVQHKNAIESSGTDGNRTAEALFRTFIIIWPKNKWK